MTTVIAMTNEDYEARFCPDRIRRGGQIHDYLRVELEDTDVLWVIPRCLEGASDPPTHPKLLLRSNLPRASGSYLTCRACLACRRRDPSESHHS